MTQLQPQHPANAPSSDDIIWSITYTAKLLRKLPFSLHSRIAKRLVNDANALIVASPKDGYAFVDRREGMFKGMSVQEQANRIERSINEQK